MPKKYFKNWNLKSLVNHVYHGYDVIIEAENDGLYAYPIASAMTFIGHSVNGKIEYPFAKIVGKEWDKYNKSQIRKLLIEIWESWYYSHN